VDERARAAAFAALGDPTRLALVDALGGGRERSISDLAQGRKLTRQGLTKHLRTLEAAGVLASRRAGRETLFALNPGTLTDLSAHLAAAARQWDEALERLKAHLGEAGD
jgi:DNA-binding transcriptional ArsR family regulator